MNIFLTLLCWLAVVASSMIVLISIACSCKVSSDALDDFIEDEEDEVVDEDNEDEDIDDEE